MGLFDTFPYTNFHELNLDWILRMLKEIDQTMSEFVAINALKYADPIQWDITTQYEKNTIVIDPQTGTAYISVAPVPIGVSLSNTDYWAVVFDLSSFVTRAAQNLANTYEDEATTTATVSTPQNGWIVWGDVLYRALVNITAGDAYVVDGNIEHFTIEDVVNDLVTFINDLTGALADLNTTDKSNLVAAINEVLQLVHDTAGDLNDLNTTDKSNLVTAINEVLQVVDDTAGDLNDLNTTDKFNLVAAINEVLGDVGDLANLPTSDQSSIVNSIIEVVNTVTANKLLTPYVNVKDYGALGDNSHDDTQAFLDAIAAATSTKKNTVYVPNGRYLITASLELDYVSLLGDTMSILEPDANMTYLIKMGHESQVDKIRFISTKGYTVSDTIRILGNSAIISNCLFEHYNDAIQVGDSNTTPTGDMILDSKFRNGNEGGVGINAVKMSSLLISNCGMNYTGDHAQPNNGIIISHGDTCIIDNCNLTHVGRALRVNPAATSSVYSLIVNNSLFDNAGTTSGGANNPCAELIVTGKLVGTRFNNCWFGLSDNSDGCHVYGNGDISTIGFSNCEFCSNGNNGLTLGNVKECQITGCEFAGNGYCGIQIGSGCDDISIIGCHSGSTVNRGTNAQGIKIDNNANPNRLMICDNNLNGNTGNALQGNLGTGSGLIRNNVPETVNIPATGDVRYNAGQMQYWNGTTWTNI